MVTQRSNCMIIYKNKNIKIMENKYIEKTLELDKKPS